MIQKAIEKAKSLIDAMPYIQRFRGETVVVKFGGSIMNDRHGYELILRDAAFMEIVGLRPVIVHGGGKAITRQMEAEGVAARFHHGLRVTDAHTISVVEQVLNHEVNPNMVEILRGFAGQAEGIHGQDILSVKKHTATDPDTGELLDWGYVGEVCEVDCAPIEKLLDAQTVPVITPLGRGPDGKIYNINADAAAGAIARGLKARKLVFLSDVPGIMSDPEDPSSVISSLTLAQIEELIASGVIAGGMLPKVKGAIQALQEGVRKTHIIDSSMPHSLLLELFTEQGVGTELTH